MELKDSINEIKNQNAMEIEQVTWENQQAQGQGYRDDSDGRKRKRNKIFKK